MNGFVKVEKVHHGRGERCKIAGVERCLRRCGTDAYQRLGVVLLILEIG